MAYDFQGTWENTTRHQAAFTGDSTGYDVKTAVEAYLDAIRSLSSLTTETVIGSDGRISALPTGG